MDSIDLKRLTDAVNGFLSSVSQTGTNVSSNVSDRITHLGISLQDKIPDKFYSVLPGLGTSAPPPPPKSLLESFWDFIVSHKWIIGAVSLCAVPSAYYLYRSRSRNGAKHNTSAYLAQENVRRVARKFSDGGRSEVVLLVGSSTAPLMKLIAQDLNIRGFIVYITCTPGHGEQAVLQHRCEDIRPLVVENMLNQEKLHDALEQFSEDLEAPVVSFTGAEPHKLSLSGVLLVVDQVYPSGPLEAVSFEHWQYTLQTNLLTPLNFLSSGGIELLRKQDSRLVLVAPVIIGSLSLPYYAPEATVHGALKALSLSLYRELSTQYIPFTEIRVGSFDTRNVKTSPSSRFSSPPTSSGAASTTNSSSIKNNQEATSAIQADILSWPENMRRIYGRGYRASAQWSSSPSQGSPLIYLYFAVFDTLKANHPPRVVHVGQGSRSYDLLSSWAPEKLITLLARSASN